MSMTPLVVALVGFGLLVTACADPRAGEAPGPPTITVLLAGDLSLGRSVGEVAAADPPSVFERIRFEVTRADIALANLESPLTIRPHVGDNANDLRADPAVAELLAGAGFDVLAIANNHAGDGGPDGVVDTRAALEAAGLTAVGGGRDLDEARAPLLLDVAGITVAVLAFDVTGLGPRPSAEAPGVAQWNDDAEDLVRSAGSEADLVIVGVHGGVEYLRAADAGMREIGDELVSWGADVVWGHGAHLVQPLSVVGSSVVATSLGNLLFDRQRIPETDRGALLEVMASQEGLVAFRTGSTVIDGGRVAFEGWESPEGSAALIDGAWWTLVADPAATPPARPDLDSFPPGDLVAAGLGDVDGDGADEIVASFRRPFRDAPLHDFFPDAQWTDAEGRSAHIGVYRAGTLESRWVASAVLRPVADLVVCDGAVGVAYATLDDPTVIGGGGWTWTGFGWDESSDLAGSVQLGCRDVDGDGATDVVLVR